MEKILSRLILIQVVLCGIIISLTSCSDKVVNNQLPGVYIWNNSQNGKLIINNDSTYSYKFDFMQSDTIQNIGTWEFDSTLQEIHFNNFRFSEREGPKGVWISRVRFRNDEIQLNYASEEGIYLKKPE